MLSKREKKESLDLSLGRLRARLRMTKDKRGLELLEKIDDDVARLKYPSLYKTVEYPIWEK